MSKYIFSFILFFMALAATAQEFNCEVIVNAERTGNTNNTIFRTLQNSLSEFVNQMKWTNREFLPHERINCSMFINVREYDPNTNSFKATIQVQSSRPVYGATMVSPVFNYNDEQFDFSYTEYEPLDYNPNQFDSNLTSVISFYVFTMLGLDADTFEEESGTAYYEQANQIVGTAQQGNNSGWKAGDGNSSRFRLNADLLSNAFSDYRKVLYNYHRKGLDLMHMSSENGKKGVTTSLLNLRTLNRNRPNSLLVRTFFDAKADEIQQVYSGGPQISTKEVVDALNNMAPTFSERWSNIR